MSLTVEQALERKRQFDRFYLYKVPFSHVMYGSTMLTLQEAVDRSINFPRNPEESLDNFCLLIFLREETKLSLPDLYEGMRVFYKVEK